jgi:hypothetical protein
MEEQLEPKKAPRIPRIHKKKEKEPHLIHEAKKVLCSKVIWVNFLALLAFVLQKHYGFVMNEELQMQILTIINIILRFWTHKPIKW